MVSTKTKKILKMQYEIYKSITKKAVFEKKPLFSIIDWPSYIDQ